MTIVLPPSFLNDQPPGCFKAPAPNEEERLAQALSWLNIVDACDGHLPPWLNELRKEWSMHNGVNSALAVYGPASDAGTVKDYIEGRLLNF